MRLKSYIDTCLEPGERIVLRARYHWLANLRSFWLLNLFEGVVITDRRILTKTGILATRTQSMRLGQIESKDISQSVAGRLLGYGDVIVAGSGGKTFVFKDLSRPLAVSAAIGRAMAARGVDPGTRSIAKTSDPRRPKEIPS